jgi:hypothetical protein
MRDKSKRGAMRVVSFTLRPHEVERLRAVARREDRSASSIVRRALARELGEDESQPEATAQ